MTVWLGRRSSGRSGAAPASSRDLKPWQAFVAFLALTAVNPTTVVYFAAVIVGNPHLADGWAEGVVFVLAAFAASAVWQLTLAVRARWWVARSRASAGAWSPRGSPEWSSPGSHCGPWSAPEAPPDSQVAHIRTG